MSYRQVEVFYNNGKSEHFVGTLATADNNTVFEYDTSWAKRGIELAPVKLPTQKNSHTLKRGDSVASTFGLFADSLPDGWGTLIMDRWFTRNGIDRRDVTPIDRLAYLGNYAMGALCYRPPIGEKQSNTPEMVNIGDMARESHDLYCGKIEDAGRLLAKIGGSPGGARPKGLIGISPDFSEFVSGTNDLPNGYTHWLVKFSGSPNEHEGAIEFIYNLMAENAGIDTPEHRLIPDIAGLRHIATKRFDRLPDNGRCHIATACGLLHSDHRMPLISYKELMEVAWFLTKDIRMVQEQFRRAAFNMFAVNRDDHSKNHGYIMTDDGRWKLSPAYDLTFSLGTNGYHSMDYNGEAKNPTIKDLLQVAINASISEKTAMYIIDEVKTSVASFKRLAEDISVPAKVIKPIADQINIMIMV